MLRGIAQFQGRIGGRGRVSLRGEERPRSLTSRTSHLAIVHHRRENIRNATASSSPREAIAWTASPKKATTCGRVRWPKLSGCPEVVETRKECVGESRDARSGAANLSITLGRCAVVVVRQLSPACHFCRQPHPDIDLVPADGFPAAHALAVKGKYRRRPSAAKAGIDSVGFMRGLKPPPPSASTFAAGEVWPILHRLFGTTAQAAETWNPGRI